MRKGRSRGDKAAPPPPPPRREAGRAVAASAAERRAGLPGGGGRKEPEDARAARAPGREAPERVKPAAGPGGGLPGAGLSPCRRPTRVVLPPSGAAAAAGCGAGRERGLRAACGEPRRRPRRAAVDVRGTGGWSPGRNWGWVGERCGGRLAGRGEAVLTARLGAVLCRLLYR